MDEYISREALLAEIAADHGNWIFANDTDELYRQGVEDNYSDTIRLINEIPAADVQPIHHGRWIECCNELDKKCSCCNKVHGTIYEREPFCPNCGARMDGEQKGETE